MEKALYKCTTLLYFQYLRKTLATMKEKVEEGKDQNDYQPHPSNQNKRIGNNNNKYAMPSAIKQLFVYQFPMTTKIVTSNTMY